MATAYYRLKKYRQLKRTAVEFTSSSDSSNAKQCRVENSDSSVEVPIEVDHFIDASDHSRDQHDVDGSHDSNDDDNSRDNVDDPSRNNHSDYTLDPDVDVHLLNLTDSSLDHDADDHSSNITNSSGEYTNRSPNCSSTHSRSSIFSSSSQQSTQLDDSLPPGNPNDGAADARPSFREKLQNWAVRFRNNLTVEAIEEILQIGRDENIPNLPKSAATLLRTKTNKNIKAMKSSKNTNGSYVYFGIEEGLKAIITDEYTENTISLLFDIDGLPLYNNSSEQFWANLGLVQHDKYESKPFTVAVFSGDSKPQSVNDYLKYFVIEISSLVRNGVTIGQRTFRVEILGFSCDTPARDFIKKCKGHGGFYACERCETRGKTKNKTRVYPSMSSKSRTKQSFRKQQQKEHHVGDDRSPLLDIPEFDPVRSVFLDPMHLLYLGFMKWILQQLLGKKKVNRKCKLHRRDIKRMNAILKQLLKNAPGEFQRKKMDLHEVSHWKATQYRFFYTTAGLWYYIAFCLKNVPSLSPLSGCE